MYALKISNTNRLQKVAKNFQNRRKEIAQNGSPLSQLYEMIDKQRR